MTVNAIVVGSFPTWGNVTFNILISSLWYQDKRGLCPASQHAMARELSGKEQALSSLRIIMPV